MKLFEFMKQIKDERADRTKGALCSFSATSMPLANKNQNWDKVYTLYPFA